MVIDDSPKPAPKPARKGPRKTFKPPTYDPGVEENEAVMECEFNWISFLNLI